MRVLCAALAAAVSAILLHPSAKAATVLPDCSDLVQGKRVSSGPVTARDLVTLADVGPDAPDPGEGHIFSISPDGRWIALQVRKADPDANGFCQALVVLPADGPGPVRILDRGGELILSRSDMLGRAGVATGLVRTIEPVWSPDGRRIAYLKQTQGTIQVWIAETDGSGSRTATSGKVEVDRFAFDADGRTMILALRPDLTAQREAIKREERSGYRFDARISPGAGAVPFPRPGSEHAYVAVGEDKRMVPATPGQIARLGSHGGTPPLLSEHGSRIALAPTSGFPLRPDVRLQVQDAKGRIRPCADIACTGAGLVAWWAGDGRHVRILRREGRVNNVTTVYEWRPGARHARRLMATTALLTDCQPHGNDLYCLEERSLEPRRLVRFDPSAQRRSVLFDPNASFAALRKSRVKRLFTCNSFGIETFGDLVYPLGYRAGKTYPLIVVQYTSRGFLRGGTGDEFPIQAFAARDYFVLSLQRPDALALTSNARTSEEAEKQLLNGFRDRRTVLSSIESLLRPLIAQGLVDPARIGITGLSDGSSTVQFAAVNGTMFAAGSASGCCWERSQDFLLNKGVADHFARSGWPRLLDKRKDFWKKISLAQNARDIRFPLLLQMADTEYLGALESFTALREAGHPVDMYVFRDEHHIKWQPAHKLAVYERNLAWFDFWLKDVAPPGRTERESWLRMKRDWKSKPRSTARGVAFEPDQPACDRCCPFPPPALEFGATALPAGRRVCL
ncbi:Atxe2 family lasso peptide isopeptidase [Novosphingobium sp. ZW T3_23]|uniref:Atxe2 family lasso peptide isopeptidase n=1 Tax=Novosphingobium sp. ZW T3_23 TaxID=3378084 RepID=UPI0038527AA6